ncbi:MAG: hypothetical protein MUC95_06320 [Spirochaetes bacterium]|nr:hypothetical protein [Spirochaetota bacterium]
MKRNIFIISVMALTISMTFVISVAAEAPDFSYSIIDIGKITRYNQDRLAFQHIEAESGIEHDNSLSALLMIDRENIYLVMDGYDDPKDIEKYAFAYKIGKRIFGDLWKNKVNSKPDYIRITERRFERMLNVTEDFVNKNFGGFYANIRNAFIEKHVRVFKSLMFTRGESSMVVKREAITPEFIVTKEGTKEEAKYSIKVFAKSPEDAIYYAEDADGDDITETLTVTINDGFGWGYKSGANIVFIYKNKSDDLKALIGKLAHDAYYGTPEEERVILSNFPPDTDIIKQHRLDENPLAAAEKEKLGEKGAKGN